MTCKIPAKPAPAIRWNPPTDWTTVAVTGCSFARMAASERAHVSSVPTTPSDGWRDPPAPARAALRVSGRAGRFRTSLAATTGTQEFLVRKRSIRLRQKVTFREPENRRGMEYCPCTIVLSFEIR
jgi:hypothetical protein